jgi:hypothetical protein
MRLQEKMDAAKAATAEKAPPEALKVIKKSTEALIKSGLAERALKTGDTAPPFQLNNIDRITINSADILKKGPMVLAFYRGAW